LPDRSEQPLQAPVERHLSPPSGWLGELRGWGAGQHHACGRWRRRAGHCARPGQTAGSGHGLA